MNRQKATFKIDHRYNPKAGETVSLLSINKLPSKTQDQTIRSSFREQINTVLQQWHQPQKEKTEYLQGKHAYDEFDRIMEEDLANQLTTLEQQEDDEEEYRKLEEMLEAQLKLEESNGGQTKQVMRNNEYRNSMGFKKIFFFVGRETRHVQSQRSLVPNLWQNKYQP